MLTALPNSTKFETIYKRLNTRAMDYKAELIRLKEYLQTEIQFINDDDALEDRYARQANKSTLEKVEQILKRGEAEVTDENIGLQLHVSGSLFYQKVEKLVDEWKATNLGEITPYSPEAEIDAGFKSFMRWLKKND